MDLGICLGDDFYYPCFGFEFSKIKYFKFNCLLLTFGWVILIYRFKFVGFFNIKVFKYKNLIKIWLRDKLITFFINNLVRI